MTDLSKMTNAELPDVWRFMLAGLDGIASVPQGVREVGDELARRLEAAEAIVEKFRPAFTSKDGVLLTPEDEAWYAEGHIQYVMEGDDDGPDEDGNFVLPGEPEQIGVGSGVHYSYEDTVYATECFSSKDAADKYLKDEAERLNTAFAAEYAAEMRKKGKGSA